MPPTLLSPRVKTTARELNELYFANGWTDGLPVVPPTEDAVREFIDYTGLAPDHIVGKFPDRNRDLTIEKVAINAVMAGCLPEYMPVIITAFEAMAMPAFEFNHIACLRSTFPHFVINGPIVKQLGMNTGVWTWGSGDRATTTISRAISLILWNCLAQRPGAVQAGAFGNPGRQSSLVIAENEEVTDQHGKGWAPLHTMFGYEATDSVVTCVSLCPGFGQVMLSLEDAEYLATAMLEHVFATFHKAPYLVMIPPPMARTFIEAGWSKADLSNFLKERAQYSVAWLKRSGRWGRAAQDFPGNRWDPAEYRPNPGDEDNYIKLFSKERGPWDLYVFSEHELDAPRGEILIVVAGGDGAMDMAWRVPHNGGQWVTKKIDHPQGGTDAH
jgi:hypothetical protein